MSHENGGEELAPSECFACAGKELQTQSVTEDLPYGNEGETFRATFDVQVCTTCGEGSSGWKAEEQRTLAMFKFEKAKGIVRTHFCSDDERKLWDAA